MFLGIQTSHVLASVAIATLLAFVFYVCQSDSLAPVRRTTNSLTSRIANCLRLFGLKSSTVHQRDVIILYTPARPDKTLHVASLSPVHLALETWLRMTKTPFITHITPLTPCTSGSSSTDASTATMTECLLSYNDTRICDLQYAFLFLEKYGLLGVNLHGQLDEMERGAVEAYMCLTDRIVDALHYLRHIDNKTSNHITHHLYKYSNLSLPYCLIQRRRTRLAYLSTLRRSGFLSAPHSLILSHLQLRLGALEMLLGRDDYMMGTSQPTTLDACAFAVLANMILVECPSNAGYKDIKEEGMAWAKGSLAFVQYVRRITELWFDEFDGPCTVAGQKDRGINCVGEGYAWGMGGCGSSIGVKSGLLNSGTGTFTNGQTFDAFDGINWNFYEERAVRYVQSGGKEEGKEDIVRNPEVVDKGEEMTT
ncbi:hypothetical protein BC830DRAFT_1089142 [Chytriomyces sp. MP71]|nr:hypothetical protein BC830DRAFT_1089142 [Chytriomyces sp. MP71]